MPSNRHESANHCYSTEKDINQMNRFSQYLAQLLQPLGELLSSKKRDQEAFESINTL